MEAIVADAVMRLLDIAKPEVGNKALREARLTAQRRVGKANDVDDDGYRHAAFLAMTIAQNAADTQASDAPELLSLARIAVALWLKAKGD